MVTELFDRKLVKKRIKKYIANPELTTQNIIKLFCEELPEIIFDTATLFNEKFDNILSCGYPLTKELLANFSPSFFMQNFLDLEFDEELMPFKENSFDLIISNLTLQHINNIPNFLSQALKILKPGGIFLASFFGEENLKELALAIYEAENKLYSGISNRMIPTIEIKTSARLLQQAGFVNPISMIDRVEFLYQTPLELLQDIKIIGQSNPMIKRSHRFFTKGLLAELQNQYDAIKTSDGPRYKATAEIITICAKK